MLNSLDTTKANGPDGVSAHTLNLPPQALLQGLVSTARGYLDIYPPVDENDPRTPLYFALLQSFGGNFNGSGSVAGLQVALDRINNEPSLLSGYSLHYTLTDSQVGQRGGRICIQQKLYSAVINNIFYP